MAITPKYLHKNVNMLRQHLIQFFTIDPVSDLALYLRLKVTSVIDISFGVFRILERNTFTKCVFGPTLILDNTPITITVDFEIALMKLKTYI